MVTWRIITQKLQPLTTPTAYVGPGDVVAGAVAWWGLRAYSNAVKGTNAVRIRRDSDNVEQDFATLVDGTLDKGAISSFLTSTTGTFVTWYDQVGTNHATQATAGSQPAVNLSGLGSFVTGDFTFDKLDTAAITQAQPNTWSFTAKNVYNSAQSEPQSEVGANQLTGFSFAGAANNAYLYGGASLTATCADGTWHARQAVYNSTSSDNNIDGTANTGDAGTGNLSGVEEIGGRSGNTFNGSMVEIGLWGIGFTGTNSSNMSANQHTFWGF